MRHRSISLVFFIVLTTLSFFGFSQEVMGEFKADVIKSKNGYIVYGKSDKSLIIRGYDNNLKLVNEIKENLNKPTYRIGVRVRKLAEGYLFDLYYAHFIVGEDGKLLSKKKWEKKEYKAWKKGTENKDDRIYIPEYDYFGDKTKTYFDKQLVMVSNAMPSTVPYFSAGTATPKGKSQEPVVIKSFTPKNDTHFSYKPLWTTKLDIHNKHLMDYKWFNFGKNNLYLYVASSDKKVFKSYIYKINPDNGNIDFSYQLKTQPGQTCMFSSLILDQEHNILICGNYKNDEYNYYKIMDMDGWFITRLDQKGKTLTTKSFPMKACAPNKNNGKPLKESDMKKLCMRIAGISCNTDGTIKLIGEHIRMFKASGSSYSTSTTPSGNETVSTTTTGKYYQTIGFSQYVLDKKFNIKNRCCHPNLFVSLQQRTGRKQNYHHTNFILLHNDWTYGCFIPSELQPSITGAVSTYNSTNNQDQAIIFGRLEEKEWKYTFYYLSFDGHAPSQPKMLSTNTKDSFVDYFLLDKTNYIEFRKGKKSYTLAKKAL